MGQIKPPGIGPQVLVLGSICQGKPSWGCPNFDPQPCAGVRGKASSLGKCNRARQYSLQMPLTCCRRVFCSCGVSRTEGVHSFRTYRFCSKSIRLAMTLSQSDPLPLQGRHIARQLQAAPCTLAVLQFCRPLDLQPVPSCEQPSSQDATFQNITG